MAGVISLGCVERLGAGGFRSLLAVELPSGYPDSYECFG